MFKRFDLSSAFSFPLEKLGVEQGVPDEDDDDC